MMMLSLGGCDQSKDVASEQPYDVTVSRARDGGVIAQWRVPSATPFVDFGDEDGAPLADWRSLTPGVDLKRADGRLRARRVDGRDFEPDEMFSVALGRPKISMALVYEPLTPLGPDGAVIYLPILRPWATASRRAKAIVEFAVEDDMAALAPSSPDQSVEIDGRIFGYIGSQSPETRARSISVIDQRAPDWIRQDVGDVFEKLISHIEALDGAFAERPILFLGFAPGGAPDTLRFSADAGRRQIRITLEAGAWPVSEPTKRAQDLLIAGVAHETAHLLTARAPARTDDPPRWFYEGAAEAIGDELLTKARLKDERWPHKRLTEAVAECGRLLPGERLARPPEDLQRAPYACGRALFVAAARAADPDNNSPTELWRAIARRAGEEGFDETTLFDVVEQAGRNDIAQRIKAFVDVRHAAPDEKLRDLLADAARPARQGD